MLRRCLPSILALGCFLLLPETRAEPTEPAQPLAQLQRIKSIAGTHSRNQQLLEWIRRHSRELDELDLEDGAPFSWIFESRDLKDSWSAVHLYAQVYAGELPELEHPVFGSPQGRTFLLKIIDDQKALLGDRCRALTLLANEKTMWARDKHARPADSTEHHRILSRATALLKDAAPQMRTAAARAVVVLSNPPAPYHAWKTDRGVLALSDAFRKEAPGETRNLLAEALFELGGAETWQKVSGSKVGLLATVRDFEQLRGKVAFRLDLRRDNDNVTLSPPSVILEQVDKNGKVTAKFKKTIAPKIWSTGKQTWRATWLSVQFSTAQLKKGKWRVRVEGKVGDGKQTWMTDARTFEQRTDPIDPKKVHLRHVHDGTSSTLILPDGGFQAVPAIELNDVPIVPPDVDD